MYLLVSGICFVDCLLKSERTAFFNEITLLRICYTVTLFMTSVTLFMTSVTLFTTSCYTFWNVMLHFCLISTKGFGLTWNMLIMFIETLRCVVELLHFLICLLHFLLTFITPTIKVGSTWNSQGMFINMSWRYLIGQKIYTTLIFAVIRTQGNTFPIKRCFP